MNVVLWLLWSILYKGKSHNRSQRPKRWSTSVYFRFSVKLTHGAQPMHWGHFLGAYHQAVNATPPPKTPRARVLLQKLNTDNFRARPPGNRVSNIKALLFRSLRHVRGGRRFGSRLLFDRRRCRCLLVSRICGDHPALLLDSHPL